MNFFRTICLISLLSFFSFPSYSQIKLSEQVHKAQGKTQKKQVITTQKKTNKVVVDKNYPDKMSAAKKTIKDELEKTDDKAKRNELIKKLYAIDNAYYEPSVRTELIRKNRPGYAARTEAYRTLTPQQRQQQLIKAEMKRIAIQPDIRGTLESRWNNIQAWEKQFHCKEAAKQCFAGSMLKCRFILDRCYEYIDKNTFKMVRAKFATPVSN